jgi:hypothetical protein
MVCCSRSITVKIALGILICGVLQTIAFNAFATTPTPQSDTPAAYTALLDYYKGKLDKSVIIVSVTRQRLYLVRHSQLIVKYPVSTAKLGVGNVINTFKTPAGLHKISKKIGAGVLAGTILQDSLDTGCVYDVKLRTITKKHSSIHCDVGNVADLITSRSLQLSGVERGVNLGKNALGQLVDSRLREILIHGTNHENTIGTLTSRGCVRMKNADIIDLFNRVEINTLVLIAE